MGVDKQKARRQRNIHLSVVCGKAADMSRDLLYVKSITFVCERQGRKKTTASGSERSRRKTSETTETELNPNSKETVLFQECDGL